MQNIKTLIKMARQLTDILTERQKRRFIWLILSSFAVAILETLGVGVIIPFVLVMLSPEEFMQNRYVAMLRELLHITDYMQMLLCVAFAIVLIYLFKTIAIILVSFFQAGFRNKLERDLSNRMLDAYIHQGYLFHVNTNSSEIVRGVHSDVSGVASIVENFSNLMSEGLSALLIGCFLISINPLLACVLLILSGMTSLCVVMAFKKRINLSGERTRDAFQKKIQYIQQSENGIKDIIVRRNYSFFLNQFERYSEQACKYNTEYLCISKMPNRIVEFVFVTGLLITSIFCMNVGNNATMLVTQLGAFAVAAVRILPSISNLAIYMNGLVYFRPTLEATYENLIHGVGKESSREYRNEEDQAVLAFQDKVQVQNVYWRYSAQRGDVLQGVTFEICKGEAVALIGPSGAGKTTMADILLGLLRPQQGKILVDGQDIYESPLGWSRLIGYVPQNLYLLDDTVRSNIAFGVPEEQIDDERVRTALQEAQIAEIVESLPQGLYTNLGEQGLKISGGQRQRIAIARALYFNPEILVLDEATSALDTQTENAVMESIAALHGKKTLVIIAHRLSTIGMCDRIYEINKGKAIIRDKDTVVHE